MYLSTLQTLPYPTAYPTVPVYPIYRRNRVKLVGYRKAYYIYPPELA